ncbi:MAG: hypothetical protein Q4C47_09250, partial [Planctomycetia bacterium]|nr:hypothetical protein [Planctomycetia bacterium]
MTSRVFDYCRFCVDFSFDGRVRSGEDDFSGKEEKPEESDETECPESEWWEEDRRSEESVFPEGEWDLGGSARPEDSVYPERSVRGGRPRVDCYGYLLRADSRLEHRRTERVVQEEPEVAEELERARETLRPLGDLREVYRSEKIPAGITRRMVCNIMAIVRNASVRRWCRHHWNGKMTPVTVSSSGGRADVGG